MMTCSTPAATASSTAYWMIGLSTSGSISLGCALVAGRKRVPQPAAGKTAFRTRIDPRRAVGWAVGEVYRETPWAPVRRLRSGGPVERAHEPVDGFGERCRPIKVGQVQGAR